jgi:hypothetical protein
MNIDFAANDRERSGDAAVAPSFANILWTCIGFAEIALVAARLVLHPGPLRLWLALCIPVLIILGAIANAIYNLLTTGHALDAPPRSKASRR